MKKKEKKLKPRKHPHLWQSYLFWDELVKTRQRHVLRIKACERGESNLDPEYEREVLERLELDDRIKEARKDMITYGQDIGPIWDWVTSIKGLGAGSLAAQLMAQIDDIGMFATISKLWMFSGYGLRDGQVVRRKKGETSPYNARLKSIVHLVAEQFLRQQTPVYSTIYYTEKERQRRLHPVKIKENGKWKFNDGHLHNRAIRKTGKIFLQHLWVKWRESEGLPVSDPYVEAIMGHTNIIRA